MFEGAFLKISRAHAQTSNFGREVQRFFSDDNDRAYAIAIERDPDPRKWVAIFRVSEKPPEIWPVYVGEIVHNLRSALDHLVFEASAPDKHGDPLTGTEFPIFIDEDAFRDKRAQKKIRGLNAATRALVERFQPFMNKDPAITPYLLILHQLSNTDKHRLLNLVAVVHTLREIKILYQPGTIALTPAHVVQRMRVVRDPRLEDGAEYLSFWTPEPLPADAQVNMDAEISISIEFGDAAPVASRMSVIDVLNEIGPLVGGLRNEFIKLNSGPI